jgi:hypothetical protein
MPDPASPAESIERFAELIALEDDGYTPRRAILLAAGLAAPAWRQIERSWMDRLAAGDDPELALRFGKAYGLTRLSFSSGTVLASAPAAGGAARDAEGTAAGSVPLPVDADDTVEDTAPGTAALLAMDGVDLPIDQPTEQRPDVGEARVQSEQLEEPPRPHRDPADATLICPLDAVPKEPWPFVPPPGKRLAFFDTQTGERLVTPVLIDAPDQG